jgi:hypothetical protein
VKTSSYINSKRDLEVAYVDSVFALLHCVIVGSGADVSEVHFASSFRVDPED